MPSFSFSELAPLESLAAASRARRQLAADPQRPRYHFCAPANWLNDPNGLIQWQGLYHLFYQHIADDPVVGAKCWGHAVSRDLVHWQDQPLALMPGTSGADADGIWSGCCLAHAGRVFALYTGYKLSQTAHSPDSEQRPCLAWATDDTLDTWVKFEGNPLFNPPSGVRGSDFRDHSAWQEGDWWYQVIGSSVVGAYGAAQLYRSHDLKSWEYCGALCTGDPATNGTMWECPSFFALDDRHVLLTSPIPLGRTIFLSGRYTGQRFTAALQGEVDTGGCFYAPQTFSDADGRRLMFGWLWETLPPDYAKRAGWAGVMSLPRVLSLDASGHLCQQPAAEVNALRTRPIQVAGRTLVPDEEWLLPVAGKHVEVDLALAPGTAQEAGLVVRASADGSERTLVGYNYLTRQLYIDRSRSSRNPDAARDIRSLPLLLAEGETLRLRVFIDASVLEVFANERLALASRIYPEQPGSDGLLLYARGGGAALEKLESWQMGDGTA